jgi:hypothetical protein
MPFRKLVAKQTGARKCTYSPWYTYNSVAEIVIITLVLTRSTRRAALNVLLKNDSIKNILK